MRHLIFIRSYRRDLEWLKFSLRSLVKFVSGFDGIILTFPKRDTLRFRLMIGREFDHIPGLRLHPVERMPNDYIGQQYTKLHADLYAGSDSVITFWDSDAIAVAPLRADQLFNQGKVLYLHTPYPALAGDDVPWQAITEKWFGAPVASEFMRRMPITVYGHHLAELRRWFVRQHGRSLWTALNEVPLGHHSFSEFNLIGAWAHRYRHGSYRWLNTLEETAAPLPCRQFWSWGGLTPEAKAELEAVLGSQPPPTTKLWWLWPQKRHLRRAWGWLRGDHHRTRLGVLRQHPPRPLRWPDLAPRGGGALPSIALVTPSYNQAPFLEATLQSVLGQDYPGLRYAVLDGGSKDGSAEIVERYRPRLAYAHSRPDQGQSDAIGQGFEQVSGDVMGWLNSDDLLCPGALRTVGRYFAEHPEVDVVYGHRIVIDTEGDEVGRWILPPHDPETFRIVDLIPQETCFWRKAVWDKVGGIDRSFRFAMDWDLFLRFQAAGARFARLPLFLGCFRVHEEQKTSAVYETVGAAEIGQLHQRELGRAVSRREVDRHVRAINRRLAWRLRLGATR